MLVQNKTKQHILYSGNVESILRERFGLLRTVVINFKWTFCTSVRRELVSTSQLDGIVEIHRSPGKYVPEQWNAIIRN